jgi:hypothetical protein
MPQQTEAKLYLDRANLEVKLSLNRALAKDILRDARQFVERATAYLQQEGSS